MKSESATMTLARALCYKKRVIQQLAKITGVIPQANSTVEGQSNEIDVMAALAKRELLVEHLIWLKTGLAKATAPIQELIFRISELKAKAALLNTLNTNHGLVKDRYGSEPLKYVAVIRTKDRDQQVQEIQNQIDALQVAIDEHNNKTVVSIPTLVLPNEYLN